MLNESSVRLTAFLGIFIAVAIWEHVSPKRQLTTSKSSRWFSNISITVLGAALVRGIFPVLAASLAAGQTSTGILNQIFLPYPLKVFLAILAFDLIIYGQHVMFHSIPLLWRLTVKKNKGCPLRDSLYKA